MTTITTTTELLTVKEAFDTVKGMLKYDILELTQVRHSYYEYSNKLTAVECKILLLKSHIVKLEEGES